MLYGKETAAAPLIPPPTVSLDYLHDELYQSRYNAQNITAAVFRLEGDLHRLTIMVGVMFFLFVVCFIGFAFYACSSYRAYCRRRKTADIESGQSIELKKIGAKLANGSSAPAGQHVISP
ncbi:uncharacterized protein LOC119096445 [Pollicipes pollicipes]|uniref:uncharacterized protein LOC119096445 n=1 Tax=Pollicipes pollicipes TaxID=41117 RepID=UPI0018851FD6|nr:uncharacterized protein LOC119096445 [Pollicipes pollicipes]